ncbi:MAG: ribosome recycling factor [Elusimicrobiota bacterium]
MNYKSLAESAMKEKIESLKDELNNIRTGRANPHALDNIQVEYYGALCPIKQVAAISVSAGRTLEIRPFDPTSIEAIEKALQKSDIGVPPQNDGKVIRLNFPAMNEERRGQLAKEAGKIGEDFRVQIRSERRDTLNALREDAKKDKMPEDEQKGIESAIQKVTDANIAVIDRLIEEKQKEITTV